MRILIVDDSAVYRKIIQHAIISFNKDAYFKLAGNGNDAINAISESIFDVVLLDVNMPGINGFETLKIIKSQKPDLPVIMISALGANDAKVTMQALEYGAMDFVIKPLEENYEKNLEVICKHLKGLFGQLRTIEAEPSSKNDLTHRTLTGKSILSVDLVVLASSTGGPNALDTFFSRIPADFNKPILIVQHMPPEFTRILAESLSKKTHYKVVEGKNGEQIKAGHAYIAPGGYHMKVGKGMGGNEVIIINEGETVNGVKPAADVLFRSVAREYRGKNIISVVLTGMGIDGTEGVRELKENCNTYSICQSEKTCVVYGMPRGVVEKNLADEITDLQDIPTRLKDILMRGS